MSGRTNPLIKYFRTWNWEVGENEFLLKLTARLKNDREWSHLETLWRGVISKRQKLYDEMRRLRRKDTQLLPTEQLDEAGKLLVASLEQLHDLAAAMGRTEVAEELNQRIARLTQS